jgi:hypothetical protein
MSAFWPRLRPAARGAGRPAKTLDELRRRSERVLAPVVVPDPFDLDAFCRQLAGQRGRPLHVMPLPDTAGVTGPCGAWAATDKADYLFYDSAAAPVHRELIVLHEVGHLLGGHEPESADPPLLAGDAAAADTVLAQWAQWIPDLSPEAVRHVLGRNSYTTRQEQEAEMIATLILARGSRSPAGPVSAPGSPTSVTQVLVRFSTTLGSRAGAR